MVVNLKTSGRPSSQEGIIKRILVGDGGDAKRCLQSRFERCKISKHGVTPFVHVGFAAL